MSLNMRMLAALFFLLNCSAVWAEEKAKVIKPIPEPISSEVISQLLVGLFIVIGVILLCAWLFKRFGNLHVNNSQIKVVAGLTLGSKEKVLLIQLGEQKQVLLGVSGQGIQRLAEYDEPVLEHLKSAEPFADRLKAAMTTGDKSS